MSDNNASAAVELVRIENQWSVAAARLSMPRIFKAFPLIATADFCLPLVVNSEKFDPREDRDTLILRPDRDGRTENMTLMEAACGLATRLVVFAAEQNWIGVPALAKLSPMQPWDWTDGDWLCGLLAHRFVEPLRAAAVIPRRRPVAHGGRLADMLRNVCQDRSRHRL